MIRECYYQDFCFQIFFRRKIWLYSDARLTMSARFKDCLYWRYGMNIPNQKLDPIRIEVFCDIRKNWKKINYNNSKKIGKCTERI